MAKMYSRKEALRNVSLSATTVWRLEKKLAFPARRQLSPGKVGYVAEEIDKWIESRQLVTNSGMRGEAA